MRFMLTHGIDGHALARPVWITLHAAPSSLTFEVESGDETLTQSVRLHADDRSLHAEIGGTGEDGEALLVRRAMKLWARPLRLSEEGCLIDGSQGLAYTNRCTVELAQAYGFEDTLTGDAETDHDVVLSAQNWISEHVPAEGFTVEFSAGDIILIRDGEDEDENEGQHPAPEERE